MARRVVLLISSHERRLHTWQAGVARAGYLLLPAPSRERALSLMRKVRPAAIVIDATLDDRGAMELLREMHGMPQWERVPIVVVGALPPEQRAELAGDPRVTLAQVDDDAIMGVLDSALGGPRPTPRRSSE